MGGKPTRSAPAVEGSRALQHCNSLDFCGLRKEIERLDSHQLHPVGSQHIQVPGQGLRTTRDVHDAPNPTGHGRQYTGQRTTTRRVQDGHLGTTHQLASVEDVFDPALDHLKIARRPLARGTNCSRDLFDRYHPAPRVAGQHPPVSPHARIQVEHPARITDRFGNQLVQLSGIVGVDLEERPGMHGELGFTDALDESLSTGHHPRRGPHHPLAGLVGATHGHTHQPWNRPNQTARRSRASIELTPATGQYSLKFTGVVRNPKVE